MAQAKPGDDKDSVAASAATPASTAVPPASSIPPAAATPSASAAPPAAVTTPAFGPTSAVPAYPAQEELHQIQIRFRNLAMEMPHVLSLRPASGIWHLGFGSRPMGGLVLSTPNNEAVHLRQMAFTTATMTLEAEAPMRALDVTVFVRTHRRLLLGSLAMPPGATASLRSSYDRTNVVGVGSWALMLGELE